MAAILWWTFRAGGALLLAATLPLVLELLVLTVASLLPRRRPSRPATRELAAPLRLAVIVPAHNEETLIARCVASLLGHRPEGVSVLVVAHNCADRTAELAAAAGAEVLRIDDPAQRGKACALRAGLAHALDRGAQAVAVVDADSVVSDHGLAAIQAALQAGAEAIQAVYRVLPGTRDRGESLTSIGFQGFNIVRPRGRERLGLSAGIFGNGFALRREVLERVPYRADSVVEDLEYHIALVAAGKRVRLLEDATVYGEMPGEGQGSKTQRARWEGGRLLMMRSLSPRLLRGILQGHVRLIEPLLDVLALPLALGALCLLALSACPVYALRVYAAAAWLVLCFHFLVAVKAGPSFWRGMAVLLRVPRYVAWKLLLTPKILLASKRNASWVRTHRGETSELSGGPPADALE